MCECGHNGTWILVLKGKLQKGGLCTSLQAKRPATSGPLQFSSPMRVNYLLGVRSDVPSGV